MRCVATQEIGPPSSVRLPQNAKKYSSRSGHLVGPVGVQPVIAQADAKTGGHPIQKDRTPEISPTETRRVPQSRPDGTGSWRCWSSSSIACVEKSRRSRYSLVTHHASDPNLTRIRRFFCKTCVISAGGVHVPWCDLHFCWSSSAQAGFRPSGISRTVEPRTVDHAQAKDT